MHALSLPKTMTAVSVVQDGDVALLKKGIWAYFLLLIFEGALRKWILPSLATPLLLVRDPLAIYLLYRSWKAGLILKNYYVPVVMFVGLAAIYTSIFFGHGNIMVSLYGARILLFHFPLIYVIAAVFDRDDVVKLGRVVLWLSPPLALLIALQFYSSQSAWVNRSVGGSEGEGFTGAMGFFRPSGTFSFTNGNTLFFGLAAAYIFYFWFYLKEANRFILLAATFALMAAIPLSISRSLFYHVAATLLFISLTVFRNPKYLSKIISLCLGGAVAYLLLSQYSFFTTAIEAFTSRFTGATQFEGGMSGTVGNRVVGGMFGSLDFPQDMPFWGYGLGIGCNVGGMLLSGQQAMLIYAEDEWSRLIGEMGPVMGLAIVVLRVVLSVDLAWRGFGRIKAGDTLPWILMSFGFLIIPQSQWGQPTTLGFSTLITGLVLAALKKPASV